MIRRLLIANRGEISLRIIRACREMRIESVAVFSDGDTRSLHVREADRAIRIGPASAAESYLVISRIVDAAREAQADAVHPGYGFLSERAALAAACEEAGLIFVGPSSDTIARMGSKIEARRLMEAAGVPVVPGSVPEDQSDSGIVAAAARLGFPLLIKPSAGGGGKGMQVVQQSAGMEEAIRSSRREAVAAFGDDTLYLERLVERPRHVEIQVFGDSEGGVVHLFERECSIQRRHQKVIEESPSLALSPGLRERMGAAAVAAATAVGYRNAGTVEFLLEGEGDDARFYFLEMNTRLQVEHPVTEAVTGVDLVHAQLTVAAGGPLPWRQADLAQRGHAIECRVYAEDPETFLPQAGRLLLYREPVAPGIRIDSGVEEGSDVSVHYDPLLGKLIAYGENRQVAVARAATALRHFPILGIRTNLAFLTRLLEHPSFQAGDIHTGFIEEQRQTLTAATTVRPEALAAAAGWALAPERPDHSARNADAATAGDPWVTLRGWRN